MPATNLGYLGRYITSIGETKDYYYYLLCTSSISRNKIILYKILVKRLNEY